MPPAEVNPAVPRRCPRSSCTCWRRSRTTATRRADGLVHDLERLRDADGRRQRRCGSASTTFRCGCCRRRGWSAATREIAALQEAFEDALAGRCRGVLVSGAPGVGKTALVDELRPVVTGSGRLVRGRQVRPVPARPRVRRGRIRRSARWAGCCWPSRRSELAALRERILAALGPNAGLLTAVVPEFAALLGVPPDRGRSADRAGAGAAQRRWTCCARSRRRKRPLVLFVDDLQWAGRTPLGFIDLVLSEEPIEGLLLVGAYRERRRRRGASAGGAAGPLARAGRRAAPPAGQPAGAEPRRRWSPRCCTWTRPAAAGLARLIEPHTRGNPYETVELLNALRRDGVLTRDGGRLALGRRRPFARTCGRSEVAELLGGARRGDAAARPGGWWRRWRAWAGGRS